MLEIKKIVEDICAGWAIDRIRTAKSILDKNDITSNNSSLNPSIDYKLNFIPNGIVISFTAEDYYIYVDQGVKGIGFGRGSLSGRETRFAQNRVSAYGSQRSAITTGKFQYKTPFVSRKMVDSISSWITSKPVAVRASRTESSRGSVIPRKERLAWAMAKHIKKTGIGKTMFWSDTFNDDQYQVLAERISNALGGEYTIEL